METRNDTLNKTHASNISRSVCGSVDIKISQMSYCLSSRLSAVIMSCVNHEDTAPQGMGRRGCQLLNLSLGILCVRVKSFWEHLSDVYIDPGVGHVVFVRLPIHDRVIAVGMSRKVSRQRGFQYTRDPFGLTQSTLSD